METTLKLSLEQVSTAVLLLSEEEKNKLAERLPTLLKISPKVEKDYDWLALAESSFHFWDDSDEDIYNDLIPDDEEGR